MVLKNLTIICRRGGNGCFTAPSDGQWFTSLCSTFQIPCLSQRKNIRTRSHWQKKRHSSLEPHSLKLQLMKMALHLPKMPRSLKKENLYLQNITVALVIETTVVEIPLAPI